MPLYWIMHHKVVGLTGRTLTDDHNGTLDIEEKHGARCLQYWYNEETGNVFCLVEGPTQETAAAAHRNSPGLVADVIVEVKEGV